MQLSIVVVFVVLFSVSSYAVKPVFLGSLCLNQVNCFVDPCQVSRCPAYPAAKCASNYCGGCNAVWSLNGKNVDCSVPKSASSVETSESKCITVNCFMNPCGLAKCAKHPNASCRANYCGGCHAWFYVDDKRVQCD
ncbi:unnamed protein product [Rotaria magnacalcarata]|uniref:Uncharacterized protein n=1 Tax=Rotaria magnacalcarata TaxID=392030 RepID=A0A816B5F9_9BILA|nr:unnamed protein product [Rotaria magnacalcarata]CAF1657474.1 unnamed protein product [Rotaria magnacalcarata]CAF2122173.1 unnamed protein product [Rotaria magnacalcarata]CAF3759552.1 unnamed protein product [Rotaria magnacalcarata]CAF3781454.1 unnamed protein product [Rotaria magnacalcarata]